MLFSLIISMNIRYIVQAKKMLQAKTLLSYRNGIDVQWGIRQDTLKGSCKSQC